MSNITPSGDPVVRRAARIAVPLGLVAALVAGLVVYRLMSGVINGSTAPASASASSAGPAATGPVSLPAPSLAEEPAMQCSDLLAHLPDRLRDLTRRRVTAGAEQNAAYGDPPITLACGVPPVPAPPAAQVFVLSGVCWYTPAGSSDAPPSGAGSTVWTTLDRATSVQVIVPARYSPAGQWVIEFSDPITGSLPTAPAPAGCS